MMLEIDKLCVSVEDAPVLRGISLLVAPGEVHAIMGPNGSGKSTLAQVLAGHDGYSVTAGTARLDGADLLALSPEERAAAGVFLAFQNPTAIPGVGNLHFLHTAYNATRRARGRDELDPVGFLSLVEQKMALVEMDRSFIRRGVNEGFSGGEKKRNEILQMAVLEPRLAILDEADSGLDIDALRIVAGGINAMRSPDRAILVITHHRGLLDHVQPDCVHVLAAGRIVATGGPELASTLESRGYGDLLEEEAALTAARADA